jgi:hypothetical protein
MPAVQALAAPKFLRKTTLRETESNTNFKMLDNDVAEAVTSAEADRVTPLMSKIYTRLLLTPDRMRESERVLRFAGEEREGKWVTAWEQLRSHLRVSGETASKALRWMHEQGIIGYYAGKNGVGIRIFLNRAASSVATRRAPGPQKILSFGGASDGRPRTSAAETPFNDSFAASEVLDTDMNPRAPKNGAEQTEVVKTDPDLHPTRSEHLPQGVSMGNVLPSGTALRVEVPVEEIVSRLRRDLEPSLQSAARRAAAQEHERTREWLESRGLPKAARVAQREAYNVLRKYGIIRDTAQASPANVGLSYPTQEGQPLSDGEVEELAQACVAMLEVKGQSVEVTLSEMSAEAGGFLPPADAPRVRARTAALMDSSRRC